MHLYHQLNIFTKFQINFHHFVTSRGVGELMRCVLTLVYCILALIAILIVDVAARSSRSCIEPTASEMSRYVSHAPVASWGDTVRQQKSIRVLCLGGSNTYFQSNKHKYPEMLNAFLERTAPNGSYAVNEGKPGV